MRHKTYITEFGSIDFRQYGYPDLLPYEVLDTLTKEQVFKHINSNVVKGNVKKARVRTGKYLYRLMWEIIVDLIMESNTVLLPYGGRIYIGGVGKSTKYANFNTKRNVYRIKLQLDRPHGYNLRMPYRRRIELKQRLEAGQNFFDI